jgi:tetratricopeptide (TPR) repeat protein
MKPDRNAKHRADWKRLAVLTLFSVVLIATATTAQLVETGRTGPEEEPGTTDPLFEQSDMGNVVQSAATHYHAGTRQLKRAEKLEVKAAETEPGQKREKAEAKVQEAYADAIKEFQEAIGYEPEMLEAYAGLGTALRRIGSNADALKVHAAALAKSPQDLENFEGWAESLLALNMLGDATTTYMRLVESSPGQAAILMQAMKNWLAVKQTDPGDLSPSDVDRLATWIEQNAQGTG